MLPTAILELGTWTLGGRGALAVASLTERTIEQIGRQAFQRQTFQRLGNRATMQAEKVVASRVEHKLLQTGTQKAVAKTEIGQLATSGSRKRFAPDVNATGAHTVFRRDPVTGRVTHYETYKPQTNPFNPKPWESVLRFDGISTNTEGHFNKILRQYIPEPHIHEPRFPGGIRPANPWEIPN